MSVKKCSFEQSYSPRFWHDNKYFGVFLFSRAPLQGCYCVRLVIKEEVHLNLLKSGLIKRSNLMNKSLLSLPNF